MRKNEIKIGREYAGGLGAGEYDKRNPLRMRVLDFNQPRKVYRGSRDYRGSTVRDGILVEVLDAETGAVQMVKPHVWAGQDEIAPKPRREVVTARQLFCTWDEQIDTNNMRAKREQSAAQLALTRKAQADSIKADLRELFGNSDDYRRRVNSIKLTDRVYSPTTIEMPLDELEQLITLATYGRDLEDLKEIIAESREVRA